MSEQQQAESDEPIWTISFVPVNAAAGAQLAQAKASGTVQALSDTLILNQASVVERRINRAAKRAGKRGRRN